MPNIICITPVDDMQPWDTCTPQQVKLAPVMSALRAQRQHSAARVPRQLFGNPAKTLVASLRCPARLQQSPQLHAIAAGWCQALQVSVFSLIRPCWQSADCIRIVIDISSSSSSPCNSTVTLSLPVLPEKRDESSIRLYGSTEHQLSNPT